MAKLKAKIPVQKASGSDRAFSPPKLWQTAAEPGARVQPVPKQQKYEAAESYREAPASAETENVNLGRNPDIRGQFARNPSDKTKIVDVSRETITDAEKKQYRAGLGSGKEVEIDHAMPNWLGGTSEPENLRPVATDENQYGPLSKAQAVIRVLFRNPELAKKHLGRELDLAEARMWAIRARDFDEEKVAGVPELTNGGFDDEASEDAVKMAARAFDRFDDAPKPKWGKEFKDKLWGGIKAVAGIPFSTKEGKDLADKVSAAARQGMTSGEETLGKLPVIGKPLKAVAEVTNKAIEGVTSGFTLGHFTPAPEPDETAFQRMARRAGQVVGGYAALDGVILKGMTSALGKVAPKLAAKAFPTQQSLAGLGTLKSAWKRLGGNVALMGVAGQLSRQEENTLAERAKVFAHSAALGVPLSVFKPGFKGNLKGLTGMWMSAAAINAAAGMPLGDNYASATTLALFHGLGGSGTKESSRPVPPKQLPSPSGAIDLAPSVRDDGSVTYEMKVDAIDADRTMTPEQKGQEFYIETLKERQKAIEAMPDDQASEAVLEDHRTVGKVLESDPSAFSGMSREAFEASGSLLESDRVRPEEGEPSVTVPGRLSPAEQRQFGRAVEDGTVVKAGDRYVPDEGTRAVAVRRPDGLVEVVMASPEGGRYPLGVIEASEVPKGAGDLIGQSQEVGVTFAQDGTPEFTFAETWSAAGRAKSGPVVRSGSIVPTSSAAEGSPVDPVRERGKTFSFLPRPDAGAIGRKLDAGRNQGPMTHDAFVGAMRTSIPEGRLPDRAIAEMNMRQLEDVLYRAAESSRPPFSGKLTITDEARIRRLEEQTMKVVEEFYRKAEAEGMGPEEIEAALRPVAERVRSIVENAPRKSDDTDPAVLRNVKVATNELGAKPGADANETALKLTIARRSVGSEPMPEKPKLPSISRIFDRTAYLRRQKELAKDVTDEKPMASDESVTVGKLKKTPKEPARTRDMEVSLKKKELSDRLTGLQREGDEQFVGTEDVEKSMPGTQARMYGELERFLRELDPGVRNVRDPETNRRKPTKVDVSKEEGYAGFTEKEITELREFGESEISRSWKDITETETGRNREKRRVWVGRTGRYVELPYNDVETGPPETQSAKDLFEKMLEEGKISGTPEEWHAIRKWYLFDDPSGIANDKFMMFMPELDLGTDMGQRALKAEKDFEAHVEAKRLSEDDKVDYFKAVVGRMKMKHRDVTYNDHKDKAKAKELWKAENPKRDGETTEEYDARVRTDFQEKLWDAKKYGTLPENPDVYALPEVRELDSEPSLNADERALVDRAGSGEERAPLRDFLASSGKSGHQYDRVAEDGTVIGKRKIRNRGLNSLLDAAAKSKDRPNLRKVYEKAAEKLREIGGGKGDMEFHETEGPGLEAYAGNEYRMHPDVATAVQLGKAGMLHLAKDHPVALVRELAAKVPEDYFTNVTTNQSLSEAKKPMFNVRAEAEYLHRKDTHFGRYMEALAGTPEEKDAVRDFLSTGAYADESSDVLMGFPKLENGVQAYRKAYESGPKDGSIEDAVGELELSKDDDGQAYVDAAEAADEESGTYDADEADLREYTDFELAVGALADPHMRKVAATQEQVDRVIDNVSTSVATDFHRKWSEWNDGRKAAERERKAGTAEDPDGKVRTPAQREAKTNFDLDVREREDEIAELRRQEEKAVGRRRTEIRSEREEKESSLENFLLGVKYRSPDMERYPVGEEAVEPAPDPEYERLRKDLPMTVSASGLAKKVLAKKPEPKASDLARKVLAKPIDIADDVSLRVYEELDASAPGQRVPITNDAADSYERKVVGMAGVKSMFPKWIPEGSRTTKAVDAVRKHLIEGTVPTRAAEIRLYEAMRKEIGKRRETERTGT